MDGSINVLCKMRSVNLKKNFKRINKNSLNTFANRKNNNKRLLILIWQRFFFSAISITLLILYVDQVSQEISNDDIKINGSSIIKSSEIINATRGFFPKTLIEINPKYLESILLKKLPVKSISVYRRIFPTELNIDVVERIPIAFAERMTINGKEKGMIDIDAYWIPIRFTNHEKHKEVKLFVEGWKSNQRNEISLLIKNRHNLGSSLEKSVVSPNGEISLQTKRLNSILIGANPALLKEQIKTLNVLDRSLPDLLINTKLNLIDLRDPSKPEIKTVEEPIQ